MSRSLSALEAKLILHLEWEKQPVVTVEAAARILNISTEYARKVLQRLSRDRWLTRIIPGKYELIPAERGEYAFPDSNPLFLGSHLVSPYYFSYATSAYHHGLTTQASQTEYLATNEGKTRKLLVRDKVYQIILQPTYHFFGFGEVKVYGSQVIMAEPEKTILDCLHRPVYCGDIPEVATMLWRGKSRVKWDNITEYALRFKSQSLIQRLGYLIEVLRISLDEKNREKLLSKVKGNVCYLGRPSSWKQGGNYDATWKVVDNIPNRELLAETEVR